MMHHDDTVVVMRDAATHKAHREFDFDADRPLGQCSSKVIIPFNSEYEFLIKIKPNSWLDMNTGAKVSVTTRRRLEIDIDGVPAVTNLILPTGDTVLSRFQDTPRKFKFVRASNAAVADPTSPCNGEVIIRLYREAPGWLSVPPAIYGKPQYYVPDDMYTSSPWTSPGTWSGDRIGGPIGVNYLSMCGSNDSKGATISGSPSNQTFSSTRWMGDQLPIFFKFNLAGKVAGVDASRYCVECGEAQHLKSKFCHNCGTRHPVTSE